MKRKIIKQGNIKMSNKENLTCLEEELEHIIIERDENCLGFYHNEKGSFGYHWNCLSILRTNGGKVCDIKVPAGILEKVFDYFKRYNELEEQAHREAFPEFDDYKEAIEKKGIAQYTCCEYPDIILLNQMAQRGIIPREKFFETEDRYRELIRTKYQNEREELFQAAFKIYEVYIPFLEAKIEEAKKGKK